VRLLLAALLLITDLTSDRWSRLCAIKLAVAIGQNFGQARLHPEPFFLSASLTNNDSSARSGISIAELPCGLFRALEP